VCAAWIDLYFFLVTFLYFAALCGYVKLELLGIITKLNHFALKFKLYLHAIQLTYDTRSEFNPISFVAQVSHLVIRESFV